MSNKRKNRRSQAAGSEAKSTSETQLVGTVSSSLRTRKVWFLAAVVGLLALAGWLWSMRTGAVAQSKALAPTEQASQGEPLDTNRLIHEKSPYLLQHAHNPVNWYPWGDEAFEKARKEQKPIFLSIGYSTCHWCHVMERESFSDPAIAEIMNQHFVSIKVDREERPDVDRIYMAFVMATTGSGGWPMSVFLTPDRKPFYGGTYFPPGTFRNLLLRVDDLWAKERSKVIQSADRLTEALQGYANASPGEASTLDKAVLDQTYRNIKASYDSTNGGFGEAPKFPRPVVFNFLLRYYARTGQKDALGMTLHTLRAMAQGGIHDHIGGGFHRYSTDPTWHVPHFEKMLYDQAQLAIAYLEAYQITHDPFFAETARDILGYVLRDMQNKAGGFYSAEDADSLLERGKPEHAEGSFYVWEAKELEQLLGSEAAALFAYYYGVEAAGNVPAGRDIRGELKGKNILIVRHTVAETARKFGKSESEVRTLLAGARKKLFDARSSRPRPLLDDKVLTAWNGLMISALARASQVLDDPHYLAAAGAAANFLKSNLHNSTDGKLKRRYRDGHAAIDGFAEDYAFLNQGLLDLYEASFDIQWLSWAVQLQEKQDELFWNPTAGGYFATMGKDPSILLRMRDDDDGAEPSSNSISSLNLLRLAEITDRDLWRKKASSTFSAFGQQLQQYPQSMPQLVAALEFSLSKPKQIIIAGKPNSSDTRALLRLVHERFIPNKVLLLADGAKGQQQLAQWLPFVQFVRPKDGRATAYICENYVCKLPTADPKVVARLLDAKS